MTKATTAKTVNKPQASTVDKSVNTADEQQEKATTNQPRLVTSTSYKRDDNQGGMTRWLRLSRVFGYLHSIREIPGSFPKVIGATITVPQGKDRQWETFQVIINSFDAHMLFSNYQALIEDKDTKVTVWFDVTNIKSKHFVVEEGDNKGEVVDYLDCTLTNLSGMSVDGNVVYSTENRISIPAEQYCADRK